MRSQWHDALLSRLAPLGLKPEREAEIAEELSQHLDDEVAGLMGGGADPADARRQALAELDQAGVLAARLAAIETRSPYSPPPPGAPSRGRWFNDRWLDIRQSARALRRAPGFTITVILTVALTIGPTTAMLSIGNWLLWHPVASVPHADRLGIAWFGKWDENGNGVSPAAVSPLNLADVLTASKTITALTGFQEGAANIAVAGQSPERLSVAGVDAAYFDVLHVPIRVGRTFRPEEDLLPRGGHVTILADGLARRMFGGADTALGKVLLINNNPMEVIGVAPPDFAGVTPTSFVSAWYPGATSAYLRHSASIPDIATRQTRTFSQFILTRATGATFADAQSELDVLAPRLAERYPTNNPEFKEVRARVFPGLGASPLSRPGYERMVGKLMLIGLALLVLGCANLANLLGSRAVRRQGEYAVRRALGAAQTRLLQLQLTESCLLTSAGAAVGLLLAVTLIPLILSLALPARLPDVTFAVPIDIRVLVATLGLSIACGLLAGLVPAWLTRRAELTRGLSTTGPRHTGGRSVVQSALASLQLALSLALVVCALLMVATISRLNAADRGFDVDGVTAHYFSLSSEGIKGSRADEVLRALTEGLSADSRVEAVSLSFTYPLGFGYSQLVAAPTQSAADAKPLRVPANYVTNGYFATLGLRTRAGRVFTTDESMAGGPMDGAPVVISAAMAAQYFGTEQAVGRVVTLPAGTATPARALRIIGVVSDVVTDVANVMEGTPAMTMYLPFGKMGAAATSAPILLVRSTLTTDAAVSLVRAIVRRIDSTISVAGNKSLRSEVESQSSERRAFAWILSLLGGLAYVLAAVGLYGLLAQIIAERTREFGIRIAIGATRPQVLASVFWQTVRIAVPGAAAGLIVAIAAASLLGALIWSVSPYDPLTYGGALVSLALVVVVSAAVPAVSAARISPVEALRGE
jgi:predicted permease